MTNRIVSRADRNHHHRSTPLPRLTTAQKAQTPRVLALFERGSDEENAEYLRRETAAIQATWNEQEELSRRATGRRVEAGIPVVKLTREPPRKAKY